MKNDIHLKGIWYLPNKADIKISGDLEYRPAKGIELVLLGNLFRIDSKEDDQEIIWGITSDGKKITLLNCSRIQWGFHSIGVETSVYDITFMLIGELMLRNQLNFLSINVRYQDFDKWLNIYGFSKFEYNDQKKKTIVEYEQPTRPFQGTGIL